MGLGRVITRRRGCRAALTGQSRRNTAVRAIFSDFGLEATVVRPARILRGRADGEPPALGLSQAPIAAISGLTPMMLMTRVRL